MAETTKRITLALSKEDLRLLEFLCNKLGENQSSILKRALHEFYILNRDKI